MLPALDVQASADEAEAGDGTTGRWISDLLRLTRDGDRFVAERTNDPFGRLFGGRIAAQALAAAGATVSADKLPQSLHAYFVRGGRPGVDVELDVDRTRDGRSFDTRRVTASQDGVVILEMLASFHRPEPAGDRHPPAQATLALADAVAAPMPPGVGTPFEIRAAPRSGMMWGLPYWFRTREPVPADPLTRACALTFVSDMGLMAAARPPDVSFPSGPGKAASLDHALWFHRPFHPEQWHCYEGNALNGNDSRGLATGAIYDAAGTLVASVVQEALWRR
jgi:acyl-CoA thioesterase